MSADTNLTTLTMITDFYKSNKHATRDLRAVVQDTFLIFTFRELQKLFLHYKKNPGDRSASSSEPVTKCNTSSEYVSLSHQEVISISAFR